MSASSSIAGQKWHEHCTSCAKLLSSQQQQTKKGGLYLHRVSFVLVRHCNSGVLVQSVLATNRRRLLMQHFLRGLVVQGGCQDAGPRTELRVPGRMLARALQQRQARATSYSCELVVTVDAMPSKNPVCAATCGRVAILAPTGI
jgi:hypothetical protein